MIQDTDLVVSDQLQESSSTEAVEDDAPDTIGRCHLMLKTLDYNNIHNSLQENNIYNSLQEFGFSSVTLWAIASYTDE
jgi:hypothetical protein